MALAQKVQKHTINDIYKLPEGQRAELIDGQIYMMAPPNRKHQDILNYLNTEINLYIRKKEGKCKVYPAPFAVFLNRDDTVYVEPDISVICDKSKLNEKGCSGAPDWVVEIVSSGSRRMDYGIKLFKYRSSNVREYWLIDPDKDRIMVWNFENNDAVEYSFTDCVKAGIYDDLEIDFSKIDF